MEIPSEFTIAEARLNTPKIARTLSPPGAPVEPNKSKSSEKDLKAQKLSFNDNITVHQYETESSSSSLCSEDIDRDMENDVTSENEILCPESPEQPDSPLICRKAKKAFQVKFGSIPDIT